MKSNVIFLMILILVGVACFMAIQPEKDGSVTVANVTNICVFPGCKYSKENARIIAQHIPGYTSSDFVLRDGNFQSLDGQFIATWGHTIIVYRGGQVAGTFANQ